MSILMNARPDEIKLLMIDPKMVELVRFNGLPHMFGKVETEVVRMLGGGDHILPILVDDLIARRRRQLAELDAAWERADSAVRQNFLRQINVECAPEWPVDE